MRKILIIAMLLMLLMPFVVAAPDVYDQLRGRQIVGDAGAPWFNDNAKMYFGADKDGYIQYNSTTDVVELSGVSVDYTGGLEIDSGEDLTFAGGDSAADFHLGSGAFLTPTGAVTIGPGAVGITGDMTLAIGKDILMQGTGTFTSGTGAVALNGDVTIASGKDILMHGASTFGTGTGAVTLSGPVGIASGIDIIAAGGAADLDYSLSSGILKTPTGQATINGPVAIGSGIDVVAAGGAADIDYTLSTGALTTPSGTNTIQGAVVIAANKGITVGAGTGAYNFGTSTGAFTTSSGANTISGDTTISGSKTFTTGTGAVTLKGDTSIDAAKKFTVGPTKNRVTATDVNVTISDTDNDFFFIGNATVNQSMTLPTAADNAGRVLTFVVATDPTDQYIIIDGEGAETVNGNATMESTGGVGAMYQVICSGTAWYTLGFNDTWSGVV
ncbi:MAG: hypothetical protein WC124_01945 [Desulfoplanes sp.]